MAATTDNLTAPIITESPVSFKSTTLPSSPVGNGAANGNKDVKHPDDTNRTPSSSANGVGITTDLSSSGAKARILTDDEESEEGGEETEDDEEEEGDEDDEDEDEEPTLKYERLGGDANNVLQRDSASALGISSKILAVGTHAGLLHILDLQGTRQKSFKPHSASIVDICLDETADYFATASLDGQVVIHGISSSESYIFDMKRPMRTVALEPGFAKRGTRAFVCGGMAGTLVMHEKGWLGHKETVLHQGEGPVYQVRWRGQLIAWANDLGIKIYDTASQTRITYIERAPNSPRADLFKCNLLWQDDSTLLIAWADQIKVARVRTRPPKPSGTVGNNSIAQPPLVIEITAVFQLDCMISGIVPHPTTLPLAAAASPGITTSTAPTSFLLLAYTPPDTSILANADESPADHEQQARKAAERPELRIVSRAGKELAADALGVAGYRSYGCNDYVLGVVPDPEDTTVGVGRVYVVLSPKDIVLVRPRDRRDRVAWLVERKRYEEALEEVERMEEHERGDEIDVLEIGQRYVEHLVGEGEFEKAARLCPRVCIQNAKRWEDWIFVFAQKHQLHTIIPFVPTDSPRLSGLVYDMILAHFLAHDRNMLMETLHKWPRGIYDFEAVIHAVRSELERSNTPKGHTKADTTLLMECLAELYIFNRQPGKALPYFLRLRRPNVFDLIRENNLFTDVQEQALLLVEFDHELMGKRKEEGQPPFDGPGTAIMLLVDHIHSIPIARVVLQLQARPYYLFLYLNELSKKDPHIVAEFANQQLKLTAEYAPNQLLDFLRASSYYTLEDALAVCRERDLVSEQVFVLGKMGNNRAALTLIIERLGDVNRAIEFARDRRDDDLWEDLLRYSETRPDFIRGLLENVGPDIDPIRLIRRIRNGLEIPGLKEALIKILHDFNLQISFLEGCQTILGGDCSDLSRRLQKGQTSGYFLDTNSTCPICSLSLQRQPQSLVLLFLCRHVVHASCVSGAGNALPYQPDALLAGLDYGEGSYARALSNKMSFAAQVRGVVTDGCPVCRRKAEGVRT